MPECPTPSNPSPPAAVTTDGNQAPDQDQARETAPADFAQGGWPADAGVAVTAREVPYQGYFSLVRYQLRHRRYGGGWTPVFAREVFERGVAAAVLPYDPRSDQVILIEQFRVGALVAGWAPWLTEIVAGIIGPGETPEQVVRREALEEAGCRIGRLEPVARYLVSPGGTSETVDLFCGEVDATNAGGIHGLVHEHEDIRVQAVAADQAIAWLDAGRFNNGITVVALHWFARHHARLRAAWQ